MSQVSRRCCASRSNVLTASSASGWWCASMPVPSRISHLPTAMKATNSAIRPITPQRTALTASTNATASGYRRCARLSCPDPSDRREQNRHVLLRHRLSPLLSEAFGGSTGLVDVEERRYARDRALVPYAYISFLPLDVTTAAARASRAGSLADQGKDDAIAEIENLLKLELKTSPSSVPRRGVRRQCDDSLCPGRRSWGARR